MDGGGRDWSLNGRRVARPQVPHPMTFDLVPKRDKPAAVTVAAEALAQLGAPGARRPWAVALPQLTAWWAVHGRGAPSGGANTRLARAQSAPGQRAGGGGGGPKGSLLGRIKARFAFAGGARGRQLTPPIHAGTATMRPPAGKRAP